MSCVNKKHLQTLWMCIQIFAVIITIGFGQVVIATPIQVKAAENIEEIGREWKGAGTQTDPFRISSYNDLVVLRDHVDQGISYEGYYFLQTSDLYFPENENWNPIGDFEKGFAFSGIYNGNGYAIYDIKCENPHAGFFSLLYGEVRNFGIESGNFSGSYIGSVTSHGNRETKIINCYNKASLAGTGRVGGIADNCLGLILFCWNFGEIKALKNDTVTAGISSYNASEIRYSYSLTEKQIVNKDTFTGNIENSQYIDIETLEQTMQTVYEGMWQQYEKEDGLITRGNTIFPVSKDGTVLFSTEFEPEHFIWEREQKRERFLEVTENRHSFIGKGTRDNPYQISCYEDLVLLRENVNYGFAYEKYYFVQTADIYFPENENWIPIGSVSPVTMYFSGNYDGNGHTIYNIHCENVYAGVFAFLDGEVKNLGIETGNFQGSFIGSIASHGTANAKIINCYNKASVQGIHRAGGIADNFSGELTACWNFGKVSGETERTCIAGITSYGSAKLSHCYAMSENLVEDSNFTGKIENSSCLENTEIEKMIKETIDWEKNKKNIILPIGTIVLPAYENGELFFSEERVSVIAEENQLSNLIAEIFLGVMIIILFLLWMMHRSANVMHQEHRQITEKNLKWERGRQKERKENEEQEKCVASEKKFFSDKHIFLKRTAAVVLTIAVFMTSFQYATGILNQEYTAGVRNLKLFKKIENKNTDILFLGGSSMSVNIELGELWKEYGIAGYCLGAGSSTIYDSYYRLIEANKIHDIKKVVVEVRSVTYTNEYSGQEPKEQNITGLSISKNKWNYVNAAVEPQARLDYFLTFPIYHTRYNSLQMGDFTDTSIFGEDDKGTWVVFSGNQYKPAFNSAKQVIDYKTINEKQEFYLYKIMEYCKKNEIELLFLKTPDGNRENNQAFYNTVAVIAEKNNIPFLDLNQYDRDIDLTVEDFYYDDYHLNVIGARKCTMFLGEYLKENYELEDHRGDPDYISWDRFAAHRENLYLTYIDDKEEYYSELARGDKKVLIIPNRLSEAQSLLSEELLKSLEQFSYEIWDEESGSETVELGSHMIKMVHDNVGSVITINGEMERSISSSGMIMVVYDEITDEIADVVSFTSDNNFEIQHIK